LYFNFLKMFNGLVLAASMHNSGATNLSKLKKGVKIENVEEHFKKHDSRRNLNA